MEWLIGLWDAFGQYILYVLLMLYLMYMANVISGYFESAAEYRNEMLKNQQIQIDIQRHMLKALNRIDVTTSNQ